MQPTSIIAALLAGAALAFAAPTESYSTPGAETPDANSQWPAAPGGPGGNGQFPGNNNGGGFNGGSDGGRPFRCNSGLQGTAQCCQTNVAGLASLTCEPTENETFSRRQFSQSCSNKGSVASCCLLPVLGQGLVCQDIATGGRL